MKAAREKRYVTDVGGSGEQLPEFTTVRTSHSDRQWWRPGTVQSAFKGLFKKAVNPEKISPKDEGKTHFQIKQTNKNNNLKRVTNPQTFTA